MRTDSTAALPQALGRYRILSRLGRGGMAEVFLSKTTGAEGIEKRLVVKRILPAFARQPKFITMFIDEAKVAMRLNHPNIVQVYAFEQVGDEFLLAMEFVDGPDLGEVARLCREQGQPMPPALAAYVALEVAKALEYAHNRRDEDGLPLDIVHRDVSPQNILLSFDGGIKLTDFGVAKAGLSVEAPGVIKGKFAYMPPEQARGEAVDRRADVYALGVVLAELLLGRPMFPGERGEALLRRKREGTLSYPGDHNPAVPAELDALVRRATLPDPQRRIPTARALAVALSQFLHGQPHPYDASSVEAFLRQLLPHSGRERRMSSAVPPPAGPAGAAGATASGEQRERRQVFVIALQLRPAVASVAPPVLAPDDRQVLADIAYKYDAVLSDASRAPTCLRLLLGLGTPSVNEALKAMRLALDLRDAVEALGPEPGRWTVAVGIVRGIVATVRAASGRLLRYDAVGNVLDLPARLAEVAAPAEILVLGEVYRLVRRVFAFAGEGGRLVDVAGPQGPVIDLQSPVRAYLLTGGRAPAAAQVKPGGSVLHGRASELAALHEALAAAIEAKQPVHRLVTGDVGVGKSALLAGFAAEVAGKVRLVRVECGFGSSEEPLSLMAELARALFVLRDDVHGDVLEARVHAGVTQWLQEGPERALVAQVMQSVLGLGLGARSAGAELPRHSVVLAFELLLQAMAIEAPMLLCLDALQWADSSSLEVLAALLGRLQHIPLLTLLGCRPDTNVEARLAAAARLHLGELGDAARRALVHDRLEGAELPRDIEDEVIARAGGNPLFIGELVETLRARQALCIREVDGSRRVTRQALLGMVLPNTLEGLVRVRLMQLIDIQRQALRWLAVAGRGVHAAELSHLAGIALGEALESLEALGWVQRRAAGGYAFLSAVVRHVTYASIDADDRKRMHAVVAQYFRQAGERVAPARCARHLEQAGLPREAARYAIRAAEQARRNYANAEALHFYARALALLPEDAPLRFQAREGRAQILRGMGLRQQEYDELQALSRQAARTGDPAMWATVHNRLARHALDGARTTGVAHHLQAALRAAQSAASAGAEVEALRLSIQLARAEGKPQDALEACDKALATAGLSPDLLAARASVLVQRSLLLQQLLQLDEALRNAVEATVIFCRLGIKRNEAQALTSLGVASALMGQLEDALAALIRSVALDREIGDRFHAGLKLSNLGQVYAELGDTARASEYLRHALQVFDRGQEPSGQVDALCALAELLLDYNGSRQEAEALLQQAHRLASETGLPEDLARHALVWGAWLQAQGRPQAAAEAWRQALAHAERGELRMPQQEAAARLSACLAAQGDGERACQLLQQGQTSVETLTCLRADRVLLYTHQAQRLSGDAFGAARTLERAQGLIAHRLAYLRLPSHRQSYMQAAVVVALQRTQVHGLVDLELDRRP